MSVLEPFNTVTEHTELAEAEYRTLKNDLAELRKEFVKKTGVNHTKIDLKSLQNIEQKMCSIEHILAHASVVYDQVEEPQFQGTFRSIITEIRLDLMGIRLKLQQKLHPKMYPKKHGYTYHTTTYHIKR